MKIIANYVATAHPPLLNLFIHDAPHRRMHIKVIEQYRGFLREAMARIGITKVIDVPIDLHVLFVNPATPDLGNAYLALEQALDGKTLAPVPGIVADDALIQEVKMSKFFPAKPKK